MTKSDQPQELLSNYSKEAGFNGPIAGQGSEQDKEDLHDFFKGKSIPGLYLLSLFGYSGLAHDARDEIERRRIAKVEEKANNLANKNS